MNKHIELAKKWLADNDSVSQTELENNFTAADCVTAAALAAVDADARDVAIWVKRYDELNKGDRISAEEYERLYGWCTKIYYSNIAGNNEKIREVIEDIAREWHTIE
jgi:hypothetical protein